MKPLVHSEELPCTYAPPYVWNSSTTSWPTNVTRTPSLSDGGSSAPGVCSPVTATSIRPLGKYRGANQLIAGVAEEPHHGDGAVRQFGGRVLPAADQTDVQAGIGSQRCAADGTAPLKRR